MCLITRKYGNYSRVLTVCLASAAVSLSPLAIASVKSLQTILDSYGSCLDSFLIFFRMVGVLASINTSSLYIISQDKINAITHRQHKYPMCIHALY